MKIDPTCCFITLTQNIAVCIANSVDPDQTLLSAVSDLGLQFAKAVPIHRLFTVYRHVKID